MSLVTWLGKVRHQHGSLSFIEGDTKLKVAGREKKKNDGSNSSISGENITEITVKLHVTRNVTVRTTANQAESAEALVALARAAAEKPYKMSPAALAVAQKTKATFGEPFLEYLSQYYGIPNVAQSSSSKSRGNKRSKPNGSTSK